MMRDEFEKLAGVQCGSLCYDMLIEQMYLSLPEFTSKSEFVKGIKFDRLQADFYIELINQAAVGVLEKDTMEQLFNDIVYVTGGDIF